MHDAQGHPAGPEVLRCAVSLREFAVAAASALIRISPDEVLQQADRLDARLDQRLWRDKQVTNRLGNVLQPGL